MNQPRELMLLSKAERALVEAKTVDEVKDYRDKAAAVKAYAKKAKLGQKLVVEAAVVKLRAERRLGEILQSIDFAHGTPGNQYTGPQASTEEKTQPIRLRDLGITKSDSSRSQRAANLPADLFERYIADNVQTQREPTMAGLLRLYRTGFPVMATTMPLDGETPVESESSMANEEQKTFPTVYAAPPWPNEEDANSQWEQAVRAIAATPINQFVTDDAHLHIWATTASLPFCFRVIKAWGFTYRSCLVCLDNRIRGKRYWRDSQQFLLFATRGTLPFSGDPQPGWLECDWPADGGVPQTVIQLIEQVSPNPYLDVFGDNKYSTSAWHTSQSILESHPLILGENCHVAEKTSS
jgi:N6-adenosine-specific RNA methylase IME4